MGIGADTFVTKLLPPPAQLPEFLLDDFVYPERLNAAVELVDRWVERGRGQALAIVNDAGQWTYAEVTDLSNRIARLLVEQEGLVPGNRVLLHGPNCAFLFAAWLGILKAGGVVVATMPLLRAGELAKVTARAAVGIAIADTRCADAVPDGMRVLAFTGDSGTGPLETRLANVAPGFTAVATRRDDPALIAFTSGTTGQPKGCVQFHRDILLCADAFAANLLDPQPGDRHCGSPPIAFTFGLGGLLIFPWRFGGTAVTVEQPSPAALLDAIERHGVTTLYTAPTAYKAMLGQLGGRALGHLKTCVSAGEHLPAATWADWYDATGIRIVDGIGATEMMHIFISACGDAIRPGATGKAVPGYIATVLDDDGNPQAFGTGRLAVKGPTGCRYLDDPRQADYVQNGWNVTGDTYRLDAEGCFWFVARNDDMIVSAGYNIAAPEVEAALLTHPAVAECAVVGLPCPERGQRVTAFVVTAAPVEVKTLQDHVKATIAPYKYPRNVRFVDALPRTATGKLSRAMLRTM